MDSSQYSASIDVNLACNKFFPGISGVDRTNKDVGRVERLPRSACHAFT